MIRNRYVFARELTAAERDLRKLRDRAGAKIHARDPGERDPQPDPEDWQPDPWQVEPDDGPEPADLPGSIA